MGLIKFKEKDLWPPQECAAIVGPFFLSAAEKYMRKLGGACVQEG